jgi:tripartite ATP-independent transporter DctM subunit
MEAFGARSGPDQSAGFLDRTDLSLRVISRGIALMAVGGMLLLSILTIIDVSLRAAVNAPIPGFYELSELVMAIVIACCFPAVLATRSSLTVDFLSEKLSLRVRALLEAIGALLLLVFVLLLTWRFVLYTQGLESRNAETATLLLPVAPFWWVVTAICAFAALVQGVVFVAVTKRLVIWPHRKPAESDALAPARGKPAWLAVTVTAGLLAAAAVIVLLVSGPDSGTTEGSALTIATFVAILSLIMLQIPLAAAMGLVGIASVAAVTGGYSAGLFKLATDAGELLIKLDLAAVPLFILMGGFASAAGVSSDVYRLANALLGRFRGGLALATIGACAGFGAVTGSSVATAATMGRVALPEMRERGYEDRLATGCVAAGGTLGMLIPPSAIMVIYAVLADTSINKMFIAAIVPAIVATLFYMAVVFIRIRLSPSLAPRGQAAAGSELLAALLGSWSVLILFGIVVGGIYGGIFTATEAAAVGAGTAFLFAWIRKGLTAGALWRVLEETASSTGMLYMIVIGAMAFAFFIGITQLPNDLVAWTTGLDLAPVLVVLAILLLYVFLGAFMDPITMLLITVPVVLPLVKGFDYDLLWWGIMTVMVIEIGMITPPLGLNVFVIKSISGGTPLTTVFRGIMPFLLADILRLLLFLILPALVLWLPSTME